MSDADNQVGGSGEPFSKQDQTGKPLEERDKERDEQQDNETPSGK